jgi:hypothetical protein
MPAAVNGLKECTQCGKTKPVSEFSKHKRNSDGLRCACKTCAASYFRDYAAANRETIREDKRRYAKRNKDKIKAHYHANKERICAYQKQKRDVSPGAVYKIVFTPTDKTYIGQTNNHRDRWSKHKSDLKLGIHGNKTLQADYDKYGIGAFEYSIIQEYPGDRKNRPNRFSHEQKLIEEYLAEGKDLYNINRYN